MKKSRLAIVLMGATLSFGAVAACTVSGSFSYCWDESGNSYTQQRIGSTTLVDGQNNQTGITWSHLTGASGTVMTRRSQLPGVVGPGPHWTGSPQAVGGDGPGLDFQSEVNPRSRTCDQFGCY